MSHPDFGFLSERQLFLVRGASAPSEVRSQFVAQIEERRVAARERNQLQRSGMSWNMQEFGPADLEEAARPPEFTGLTAGPEAGAFYFALQNESVGGLFLLDARTDEERRLLHKQQLWLTDLDRKPGDGELVCSTRLQNGAAHIATLAHDGGAYTIHTEGDVIDEAPRWVPGTERAFVYQSAGIGRDEHGAFLGLSPYTVHQLDLASGTLRTLLEYEEYDCLGPCLAADGTLYYIRRPYEFSRSVSAWQTLKDAALFPYRLFRAGMYLLNAFSQMISNKPLISAGGPQRTGPDQRSIWLRGRWIEVRDSARPGVENDRPLVPSNWELLRRTPDGREERVAENVVAFDLAGDGRLLYTDGRSVFATADGGAERVCRGKLIQTLRILG